MSTDRLDLIVGQWAKERPDLDATPMAVVGRILRLARRMEDSVEKALAPFELALWEFDVLATLRRHGPPFRMSASLLAEASMLTSGAMTNRIDRLEKRGLVQRRDDPDDRRGVLVALTPRGVETVDRAIEARFAEARTHVDALSEAQRDKLERTLKAMLSRFPGEQVTPATGRTDRES